MVAAIRSDVEVMALRLPYYRPFFFSGKKSDLILTDRKIDQWRWKNFFIFSIFYFWKKRNSTFTGHRENGNIPRSRLAERWWREIFGHFLIFEHRQFSSLLFYFKNAARWKRKLLELKNINRISFAFLIASLLTELTSGHCQNSRKTMCNLPGLSFRSGDVCVPGSPHGSTENLEMVSETSPKNVALTIFCFLLFSLVPQTLHVDPKTIVFGMGWNWFAGSTWDFYGTKQALKI